MGWDSSPMTMDSHTTDVIVCFVTLVTGPLLIARSLEQF